MDNGNDALNLKEVKAFGGSGNITKFKISGMKRLNIFDDVLHCITIQYVYGFIYSKDERF